VEAYALYLKGRYNWAKRTEPALKKGIEYFEEAIARDPGYALAHVGLADSYNILGFQDLIAPREAFPRAHAAARHAMVMDPSLAAAHAAEGYALLYFDWDWEGAELAFKRAIELEPRYPTAPFYYSNLLQFRGRIDEAFANYTRALELDPLALIVIAAVGQMKHLSRKFEEAIPHYRAALDLDPDFLFARWWLGMNYAAMGRLPEAQAELERTVALTARSHPTMLAGLARVHALAGHVAEARALIAELARAESNRFISSFELATVHSALGDQERAMTLLERAYEEKSHSMCLLAQDPRLDALRGDPRFAALRAKVRI
jgi:tetratricopeptide (TPR) repeat protein